MWANSKQSGFTIVELLVVIVVISILAAITIVAYNGVQQKAIAASLTSDLNGAANQLKLYQVEHSVFPTSQLTVNGNLYCPLDDNKYCFKASPGNAYQYVVNNSANPQSFNLSATNNSTIYTVTSTAQPTLGGYQTPGIVTNGLVLNLDAGNTNSYPAPHNDTNWTDLSGNNNHGTLMNGVGYASANGGALSLDGVNDYVVAGNSGMIHRTSDFTYNIWAMHSVTPDQYSTYFENGLWGSSLLLRQEYNTITVYAMSSLWGTYAFTPTVGAWFDLSFVRSGNSMLLYINGVYSQSVAFSADVIPSTNYVYIGTSQHSTPQTITGKIANAQVYNRALSAAEISQNFNAIKSRYGL